MNAEDTFQELGTGLILRIVNEGHSSLLQMFHHV